jgi:hypothetical protein
MKKLARLRVLATNSADKLVTAMVHDGGNLFRSLRFAGSDLFGPVGPA